MREDFPLVLLSEILTPVSRRESIESQSIYRILGARWYAAGLYIKDVRTGTQIQAKEAYRIEEGDFVYNRLFAWKGSFAIATSENHGCYVSNEFPCFRINQARADSVYLRHYFSRASIWSEALDLSTGGTPTSRNRLKEECLLAMTIPLPPLEEQRRVAARIEELRAKVEEAHRLRQHATEERERLLISMAHRLDLDATRKANAGWKEVVLGEVIRQVQDIHRVQIDASYPNLGIYSFGRGLFPKPPIGGVSTSATMLNRVHKGQFIYSRLFAFEGAYGMVSDKYDGCFVSMEYPTFECDLDRVKPEFMFAYFKSPRVWSDVATGSKGLGHRRQRVQPQQLLTTRLMLPPMSWQNKIVEVQRKVEALKHLQAESATELNALIPAILDRAFRGSL